MRYDKTVYFQQITPGKYNPDTGDYEKDTVTEKKECASVTDSGVETMKLIYGAVKQGVVTIRLQNHVQYPFSSIRIGRKVYSPDFERQLRNGHVFVASEVQSGGRS